MHIKVLLALAVLCGPALAATGIGAPATSIPRLPPVLAEKVATFHASLCAPSQQDSDGSFFYSTSGVFAVTPAGRSAVLECWLGVQPVTVRTGALSVVVDGTAGSGGLSATCGLSSLSYTGTRVGGMDSFTASGTFSRRLTLTAAQMPTEPAVQVLSCSLPGGWNAGLYAIELVQ